MADLRTQNKQPVLRKAIFAADEIDHHHSLNVKGLQSVPMTGPFSGTTNLLSRSQNLKLHLCVWKPSDPNAWAIAQRVSLGLNNTLDAILIQEHFLQTAEAGMSATPQILTDTSSPSAPSLEELDRDLKTLAAFKLTMPPALAEALKNFQKQYDIYVSEEKFLAAKHPSSSPNHPHPEAELQPQE